jgi:hypothetical protein
MKTENNILIADFIGLELEENHDGTIEVYAIETTRDIANSQVDFYEAHELLYHFSWDWLIPVIAHIKNLNLEEPSETYRIDFYLTGCNIEYTYEAVVEFIKWYKENN